MSKGICSAKNLDITVKEKAFNKVTILLTKPTIVITNCKQVNLTYDYQIKSDIAESVKSIPP